MYLYSFKVKMLLSHNPSHMRFSVQVCCCCSLRYLPFLFIFSFIFYCETAASVATLWNNWLVQNKFNAHVRPAMYMRLQKLGGAHTVRVYYHRYIHTILETKFVSHTLFTDSRVHVKTELYFGLYRVRKLMTEFLFQRFQMQHAN